MTSARVTAQAKVNLFLRVLAREASGFHQLETLFCRLALGDDVVVRPTRGARSLDCRGPAVPPAGLGPVERNLAWRAAVTYTEATAWPAGFTIEIDKRIPVGGGLGGGSADAGAVLRALNALAPTPLSPVDLLRLGQGLGADVPFLTQDLSPLALAWGRGERLLTLPALPERDCLIRAFPFGISTVDAYSWLAESPAGASAATACSADAFGDWRLVARLACNEFERVVIAHQPSIGRERLRLQDVVHSADGEFTLMSGSGASVFAILSPGRGAELARSIDPPDADATAPGGIRTILTATATHVEPVTLGD